MATDLDDDDGRAAQRDSVAPSSGAAPDVTPSSGAAPDLAPSSAAAAPADPPPDEVAFAATGLAPGALDAASTLDALPRRPEGDRLARAVARAKIASSLFAAQEQVTMGRYRLLELVGAGGMGVVWGAWDPKLERRVAVKLVKAQLQAARERILIEGQALAKLSHPNVVPVFDVGVYEEQVYLVMEWVRGKNLRAYCQTPRSVRELLRVYRQAGAGLWAAHQAGLIHRDFKPDNAIVGDDGRVRVLDFGLVREHAVIPAPAKGDADAAADAATDAATDGPVDAATDGPVDGLADTATESPERARRKPGRSSEVTRGAGTPRYMPPEQAAGEALTASVDQYAFCVSLREALLGRLSEGKDAEIPRWLEEILARGASMEASSRFTSMEALLQALDRDPATLWRRRAVAGGAVALAVAAFAVGRARSGPEVATCTGGREEILGLTGPAALGGLAAHLRTLGPFASQEAGRMEGHLREYGERWAQAHRASCLARQRKEMTAAMYDRSASCLIRGKAALATIVGVLGKVADSELPAALAATRDLPAIDRCLTSAATSTVAPPAAEQAAAVAALTSEVEGVRMLGLAARPEASAAAARLVATARTLGYQPALAQALLTQQIVRVSQKSAPDAPLPPHHEATQLALQIGDDPLAVETYARELYVRSREGLREHPDTMALIEALARRLGPEGRFPRALLHNNLGAAALAAGDRKTAQPYFRRALEEARLDTTENIELAYIPMNLALAVDAPGEAEQLFTEGITRIIRLLGPQHPLALSAQTSFVLLTANAELARSRAQTTCDRYLTWHPHLGQEVVECAYTLGWLADERGDSADAARWMKVASGPQADEATIAKAYLRFAGGDATLPVELDALAAELRASQTWWRRTWASDAGLLAALTWRRAGQPRRALAALEAALPVIEETNRIQSNAFHQRRLARVRAELAMELMKLEPARARQLQNQAIAWYTQAGGYDRLIARLSASL